MILFDLKCGQGHVFEAWFKDGETYAAQRQAREISCPRCASTDIAKAPMAPRVQKSRAPDAGKIAERIPATEKQAAARRMLGELRRHIEDNCDNVGPDFAEEARKIHYGEVDPRGIYGEASEAESSELDEEGVPHQRIPWVERQDS